MSMHESILTRLWCRKLEAAGASVLPVIGGMMGRSGWPDRYIAYCGGAVWLEFKVYNGKLSPEQRAVIAHLNGNKARAYVARFSGNTVDATIAIEDADGRMIVPIIDTRDLLQFICGQPV